MEQKITEFKEETESYSNDDLFNITSWGADLSFRELVTMYEEGDLLKPELQRKYVWNKKEASRFIDSILLGLPVPSIFLAKQENESMLIIDGYQRIMTIFDFIKGNKFQDSEKTFNLVNSEIINDRWRGKTFLELTQEEQRKIRTTTIHAIIFEQKHPQNDTGMYQIFERINTSGSALKPQEIRNCVYQGDFNTLLFDLNERELWRVAFGSKSYDARMFDLELILRYFAMSDLKNFPEKNQRSINLVKYLNNYMSMYQKMGCEKKESFKARFENMLTILNDILGDNMFKRFDQNKDSFTGRITPPMFDAISAAADFASQSGFQKNNHTDYLSKYKELLNDQKFISFTSVRTTNIENIKGRIERASEILFGLVYEF
ncbi:DUF262 domain-containing protein [Pasteurella dagmatis]|uniref:GmrSD restriction endonucleases N-terminal domain-containing protein n=1 Tax=Pasteurella dagmatis ATCC 43325 TaxID=667128 RepID=C9PS49_9PAST|nr:DUF262 domain-containing protein [Pasteurella dagmatis]EEX49776.1 hypothetical protein HMPREF0621_1823 [Pasteurella dagmatis ATCC 43325]SNV71207.1 Uncharacterized conserved protein [Pasteurella dagmatis]